MPGRPAPLPPIPTDTARAAEAAFGKGNLYLTIGDQASRLFADADLADLNGFGEKPAALLAQLALATIFQFVEDLPDYQASEATRARIDWKYALHLPLDHPGFDHQILCDFRQRLLFDAASQQVFQCMLARLAEVGLLGSRDKRPVDAANVLISVCTLSRVEELARAMRLALESIATHRPEWLRAIALPHWYERYDRLLVTFPLPHTGEEQESLALAIGTDASYLLETIKHSNDAGLSLIPEVRALLEIWRRNFDSSEERIKWRLPYCAGCGGLQQRPAERDCQPNPYFSSKNVAGCTG